MRCLKLNGKRFSDPVLFVKSNSYILFSTYTSQNMNVYVCVSI